MARTTSKTTTSKTENKIVNKLVVKGTYMNRKKEGEKEKEHSLMTDYAPLFVIKNRGMMFPAPYFTLATMALNASG